MDRHNELLRRLRNDEVLADRVIHMLAEPEPVQYTTADAMLRLVRPMLVGRAVEHLACVALDSQLRVIDRDIVSVGGVGFTVADPVVVLRWVLTRKRAPTAFILAHNHPSGGPTASREDMAIWRRMHDAATTVGLRHPDHLIVVDDGRWTSMQMQHPLA